MARKVPFFLFLVVFAVFVLYPGTEQSVDSVNDLAQSAINETKVASSEGYEDVQFDDGSVDKIENTKDVAASENHSLVPTPVPTPTPTPKPTVAPTPTPDLTPEPTPMGRGMSGAEVTLLQSKLIQLGFMQDEPDGVYGADTETAVKELQTYLNEIAAGKSGATGYIAGETYEDAFGTSVATPVPEATATSDVGSVPTPSPAYPVDGRVSAKLMQAIEEGIPVYNNTIANGSTGTDVKRIQRRLHYLGYAYLGIDGAFGNKTAENLSNFQKQHGLTQTGIADKNTTELLFSEQAQKSSTPYHPYAIKVDVSEQRVYVYAWNDTAYNKLVKKMKCSTGLKATPTPLGTYTDTTGPLNRWHYFKDFNCWAQYSYSIQGNILFHSVLYSSKNEKSVTRSSVRNLGRRASHGCVRLAVKDAKWIFENCPAGTTVVVQK